MADFLAMICCRFYYYVGNGLRCVIISRMCGPTCAVSYLQKRRRWFDDLWRRRKHKKKKWSFDFCWDYRPSTVCRIVASRLRVSEAMNHTFTINPSGNVLAHCHRRGTLEQSQRRSYNMLIFVQTYTTGALKEWFDIFGKCLSCNNKMERVNQWALKVDR